MTLSAVILCRNEEANLPGAIASVAFADEIVIVDGGSTDRSIPVAIAAGVRVVERPFDGFAHQRNFGLAEATGTWVLFLDADERVPPKTAEQIASAVARCDADAYRIPRSSIALGEPLAWHPGGPDEPIRLMRRAKAHYEGAVHERCHIDGRVGRLKGPLEHRTHRSISDLVDRIDRYSSLEAAELHERGARVLPPWRVLWTMTTTVWRYWRQGLRRHGMAGAIEALALGFDRALVAAKIWELEHQDEIASRYVDDARTTR